MDYSTLTKSQILEVFQSYTQTLKTFYDSVIDIPDKNLTWKTYIQPTLDIEEAHSALDAFLVMSQVHPNPEIRDVCTTIETSLAAFRANESMRVDLYDQFLNYLTGNYEREKANGTLQAEQIRYFEEIRREYRRSGIVFIKEDRDDLTDLRSRLSEFETTFLQNINDYSREIFFSTEEFPGMPTAWITERTDVETGRIRIGLEYPDYHPVMEFCQNRDTRRKLYDEYIRQASDENRRWVSDILWYRHKIADVIGYKSHYDYAVEENIAKRKETVTDFLNTLKQQITPLVQKEHAELLELAQKDGVDELQSHDIAYYSRIYRERKSDLSMEAVGEHFRFDSVTNGIFHIFESLFGFIFVEVSNENTWHPDVRLFEVRNTSDKSLQGKLYLDMYPREGKYGHAATFPLRNGSHTQIPEIAIVCNFPRNNEPMMLDDVETYLHEFGHAIHHISSRPLLAPFAGLNIPIDAVECPSQLMEEWCYQPESLRIIAPTLPEDMIHKICQQRKLLQGFHVARQLAFCYVDVAIHTEQKAILNGNTIVTEIYRDLTGLTLPEDHAFLQSWGHLVGYDVGYYGYLYAKVFAVSMFEERFKGKLLDAAVGKEFRDTVLAPGNTRDFLESCVAFLGHTPDPTAFLKSLDYE